MENDHWSNTPLLDNKNEDDLKDEDDLKNDEDLKQAGAELGQAQLPTGIWLYCD